MINAEHDGLGHGQFHVDLTVGAKNSIENRLQSGREVSGADRIVKFQLNLGAVGQAEAGSYDGFEQDTQIVAVADIVRIELQFAVRGAADAEGIIVDGGLLSQFPVQDAETGPDRQPFIDPVADTRVDPHDHQLPFLNVVAPGPTATVIQTETEIGANPDPQLQIRTEAMHVGKAGYRNKVSGIPAIPAGEG